MRKRGLDIKAYSREVNIPIWKLHRIRDMFLAEVTLREISSTLHIGTRKLTKVLSWLLADIALRKRNTLQEFNPRQYYKKEDEMLIQDYKAEDLTGEEKLIFEKL